MTLSSHIIRLGWQSEPWMVINPLTNLFLSGVLVSIFNTVCILWDALPTTCWCKTSLHQHLYLVRNECWFVKYPPQSFFQSARYNRTHRGGLGPHDVTAFAIIQWVVLYPGYDQVFGVSLLSMANVNIRLWFPRTLTETRMWVGHLNPWSCFFGHFLLVQDILAKMARNQDGCDGQSHVCVLSMERGVVTIVTSTVCL